jgi:hypothetical protein
MSVHYRLCLVTVRMKVMQMGGLTDFWRAFSWSVCNRNVHFIRFIQSSGVQGCDGVHRSGKTSSAERNSGKKPKQSERDRRTLKRIVSKNHRTTAAKVTAELDSQTK